MRRRRALVLVAGIASFATLTLVATLCLTSGCASVGYLWQSARGHVALLHAARPVSDWLADPATSAPLKARLELSQRMRDFAISELGLPDNPSYRSYADLGRKAATWSVVAAPELSLKLKTWCFPVVGCVGYRGYFDEADAQALADTLAAEGWEVDRWGVPAYSTLGYGNWLGGDPLLSTFIQYPEGELARMLFHELSHQVVYVEDDTAFNESFATAVERLGSARWLAEQADDAARREFALFDQRRQDFRRLTATARVRLEAVYASPQTDEAKRRAKADVMQALRDEHARLKHHAWHGYAGYDAWFARANNASLGVLAAYNDDVAAFEALFEAEARDFKRFYAAVRSLAALPGDERRKRLEALRPPA